MVDYYERIELAIQFMESRLRSTVTVPEIAAAAFSSRWHFQRIFRYMTGHSVAGYLRDRRLSEAGYELITGSKRVIDVALEYGYDTPESFTRAFRRAHGINPGRIRTTDELRFFDAIDIRDGKYHDVYPNVAVGEHTVVRNETVVAGLKNRTGMRENRAFHDIPKFWGQFFEAGVPDRVERQTRPGTVIGVYHGWDYDECFDLTLGVQVEPAPAGRGRRATPKEPAGEFTRALIPAGKYAVFTIPGSSPYDLVAGWKYIYGTWMPNTRAERAYGIDFDLFDERFTQDESALSEIYIPIR